MRLQVLIATASWTSSVAMQVVHQLLGLAGRERKTFAQGNRRGLVGNTY